MFREAHMHHFENAPEASEGSGDLIESILGG